MRANLLFVQNKFKEFNQLMFSGELPPIAIRIGKAKSALGSFSFKRKMVCGRVEMFDFKLTVSAYYDFPENCLEDIIIHEMIHYYIRYKNIVDSSAHGRVFRSIMKRINERYGRNVSVSVRNAQMQQLPSISVKPRPHYLCVAELHDGRVALTVVSKSKIAVICRQIFLLREVKSFRWYMSTDSYFDKYPRCLKCRLYLAEKELDKHLADAVEIGNTSSLDYWG